MQIIETNNMYTIVCSDIETLNVEVFIVLLIMRVSLTDTKNLMPLDECIHT